jgi:hypothetical protein
MLLHAFFAAASHLLRHLTENPTSPSATSDLHLVRPFLRLLETLSGDPKTSSRSEELGRMHRTCSNLNIEAEKAIQLSSLRSRPFFA